MDEDYFFNTEKQSIRESARSLKKYGSTCNHVRNSECLVRHELAATDTLQGIALKYGCTTEQIRRSNRLFAQDSLFLRQFLMIPVDKDSQYLQHQDERSHIESFDVPDSPQCSGTTTNQKLPKPAAPSNLTPEEENRKDIDDFLGKIDLTLAETKRYVAKSQNSFDYTSSENEMFTNRRPDLSASSSFSSSSHHMRTGSSGSNSYSAMNNNNINNNAMTQGRRVQSSLQRLEKQQDEFFEL